MEHKGLLAGLVAISLVALSALAFISLKSPSVIVTGGGNTPSIVSLGQNGSEEPRYGGTTGLDTLALTGNLSVAGTTSLTGAISSAGSLAVTGALTAATSTFGGSTLYVDPLNKNVSVNTTTGILADLYVYSGSTTVSSTVAIGDSLQSTRRGTLCFWNGTNYTLMFFVGNATPLYATSATCTN